VSAKPTNLNSGRKSAYKISSFWMSFISAATFFTALPIEFA